MEFAVAALVLLVVGIGIWRALRPHSPLQVGDAAPDFQLLDQQGVERQLGAYRGHWLVVFFYPRDDTPGCTREACDFRDDLPALQHMGAEVVGISGDSVASHARFATKFDLPFPLLADPHGLVAAAYGVWVRLGPMQLARRTTFIVTPEGRLGHIFRHVRPASHAADVGKTIKELQSPPAYSSLDPAKAMSYKT